MPKDYQKLWRSITKDTDRAEAVQVMVEILADKEGRNFIFDPKLKKGLPAEDAKLCVEILYCVSRDLRLPPFHYLRWARQGVTGDDLESTDKNIFLVTVRRLAEHHELLPDCMEMEERIEVPRRREDASGGFSLVRFDTYKGLSVAVRTAKVPILDPEMLDLEKRRRREDIKKIRKVRINGTLRQPFGAVSTILFQRFYREVVLWGTLSHPNVLELVGVQVDVGKSEFVTVSERMERGTIMEYIGNCAANRLDLVRCRT